MRPEKAAALIPADARVTTRSQSDLYAGKWVVFADLADGSTQVLTESPSILVVLKWLGAFERLCDEKSHNKP